MSEVANAKTLRDLEFERLRQLVAGYAASPLGRSALVRLMPSAEPTRVRAELQAVQEMGQALQETALSLGELEDLEPVLLRAQNHLTLEADDFLQTLRTLRGAQHCRVELAELQGDHPALRALAHQIQPFTELEGAIARTFNEEGEMLPTASPLLRRLKKRRRLLEERAVKKLRALLSSPQYATLIQEPLITRRSNRLVIPIKSALKGGVECVVHDSSDSGQTLYVEPTSVIAENNEIRELDSQIRDEQLRILQELTGRLKGESRRMRETLRALARLDSLYGRARYALAHQAHIPQLNEQGHLKLVSARHPLLDPGRVVPIDFALGDEHQGALITGPNTGGKTVSLKTVGLLTLMTQAGIPIPAEPGSEIACFELLRSDIGDEQSLEQNLSTFSAHLRNLAGILAEVGPRALVLIDELGAGTDPQEGTALGIAVLRALLRSGARLMVTTHFGALKHYAYRHAELKTYSVDFDVRTLSPTYRLLPGVGASNAFIIAERLGLSAQIIADARHFIAEGAIRAEEIIGQLQEEHRALAEERTRLRRSQTRSEQAQRSYEERQQQLEREQGKALGQELRRLSQQVKKARRELETLLHRARRASDAQELQAELRRLQEISGELAAGQDRLEQEAADRALPAGELRPGERVWLVPLNEVALVRRALDKERVLVDIGGRRIQVKRSELRAAPPDAPRRKPSGWSGKLIIAQRPAPPLELQLHGLSVNEALPLVESYLDRLLLADRGQGMIVHGKGTGTLRRAVRHLLAEHPCVKSFSAAPLDQGGEGVTLVELD